MGVGVVVGAGVGLCGCACVCTHTRTHGSSQVDMDMARSFLSLPRVVCQHPETGKDVLAGVGPYGGFVRHRLVVVGLFIRYTWSLFRSILTLTLCFARHRHVSYSKSRLSLC